MKSSSCFNGSREHSYKSKCIANEERQEETFRKLKKSLAYNGRLHSTCHAKGQDNKRNSPLSPWTSVDEAVVKEGALRALTNHGQGE
jgi:hypothetical protein